MAYDIGAEMWEFDRQKTEAEALEIEEIGRQMAAYSRAQDNAATGESGLPSDTNGGYVYDGDTIYKDGVGYRLQGGDTREINRKSGSAQPMSIEAQRRAYELLTSGEYTLRSSGEKDTHGRLLGSAVDANGNTVTEELLREGLSTPTNFNKNSISNHIAFAESIKAHSDGTLATPEDAVNYGDVQVNQRAFEYDPRNFAQRAKDRGWDKSQMNLYQFTELIGDMSGVDVIKEWGEEGVIRNMIEAARSPSEIESYEDVDTSSIKSIGTYVIEKALENAPGLLIDLGVSAAAIATGTGIPAGLALATGRSFVHKIGWKAAGKAGLLASMGAQMTGESRHSQLAEGVDSPFLAVTAGLSNTALEFRGFSSLYKGLIPDTKIESPASLAQHIAQRALISTGVEGTTEWLQDLTNQLTIKMVKPEHEIDWHQLTESFFAGAAAGGGTGTVTAAAGGSYQLMNHISGNTQLRRSMDGTAPEAPSQIEAQIPYIMDPKSSLDAVYSADPEMAEHVTIPDGVSAYKHESGVLFTSNEAKGKAFEREGNKDATETLGYAQTKEEIMATTKVEDIRLVVARDAKGVVVGTEVTNVEGAAGVQKTMGEKYGHKAKLTVAKGEGIQAVISERQQLYNADISLRAEKRKGFSNEGSEHKTDDKPTDLNNLESTPLDKARQASDKPGTQSMRDASGKLRSISDLIKGAISGEISAEEIAAEAKKAGVESRPTTRDAFPRQRIIKDIISKQRDARKASDEKVSFEQIEAEAAQLRSVSNDKLKRMAEERGISLDAPHPIAGRSARGTSGKHGAEHRVATALIKKLNNTKGAFVGNTFEDIAFLFDDGTDTTRGANEKNAEYAQRLLHALKLEAGLDPTQSIAKHLEALSDYELSELAEQFFLSKITRNKTKTIQTTREDDVRQLMADIVGRESKPAAKQAPAEETPASKARSAANRRQQNKRKLGQKTKRAVAHSWELLHAAVHELTAAHLKTDDKGKYVSSNPDSSYGEALYFDVATVLEGIHYDNKTVRDQIVNQLTELLRFHQLHEVDSHSAERRGVDKDTPKDKIAAKKTTHVERLESYIDMVNNGERPTLPAHGKRDNNARFINMLQVAFNTRVEDAANKEAARSAKIQLTRLLVKGRVDLTLIAESLKDQVGFNRSTFAAAYIDRFMDTHAKQINAALHIISGSTQGAQQASARRSPEQLLKELKADMANTRPGVKSRASTHFPSMMLTTGMMSRHIDMLLAHNNVEERSGMTVPDIIRSAFIQANGDAHQVLGMLGAQNITERDTESYYAISKLESTSTRRTILSATASGISPVEETKSQERASIDQFFHAMYRATLRFRRAFAQINTPHIIAHESAKLRLARFRGLKLDGAKWLEGKRVITVDFETFFDEKTGYTLQNPDLSTADYIDHADFEILGLAVQEGDATQSQYIQTDKEIAAKVAEWKADPNIVLVMHNAKFDSAIFQRKFGYMPNHIIDTMRLSQGIRPEKNVSHKLSALSEWVFPDNKELQKIKDGVSEISGLTKAQIAAAATKAAQFEEYAKRDVQSTQAIALKLAPLVAMSELEHQSAGIINDVTGKVSTSQGERQHSGEFGDKGEQGQRAAVDYRARAEATNGANLLEVQLTDGKDNAKTVMIDAVAVAQYHDQTTITTPEGALESLLSNLARMAVGSQPRAGEELAAGEQGDLVRMYKLPAAIPDSLVIYQDDNGHFYTVGDARKRQAFQKREAQKANKVHGFLEGVTDKLDALRSKLKPVIEALESDPSEAAGIARDYVFDLMHNVHENTRTAVTTGGHNMRTSVMLSRADRKVDTNSREQPRLHISIHDRIQEHVTEIKKLSVERKHLLAQRTSTDTDSSKEAIIVLESVIKENQRAIKRWRAEASRLVEVGYIEDYVLHHSEIDSDSSAAELTMVKEELEDAIRLAGGTQVIDDILSFFGQIKAAHHNKMFVDRNTGDSDSKDTGDKLMDKDADTGIGDTDDSLTNGLQLIADSRFKDSYLLDPSNVPDKHDVVVEEDGTRTSVERKMKDDELDTDAVHFDQAMEDGWNTTHSMKHPEAHTFPAVADDDPRIDVRPADKQGQGDTARRTGPTTLLERVEGEGTDPSYGLGSGALAYRVYGPSWVNPQQHFTATGKTIPLNERQKANNAKGARQKLVSDYFGSSKVKSFGSLSRLRSVITNMLSAVNIKQNVALMDASTAVKSLEHLRDANIISQKVYTATKRRLKTSYANQRPAYINMGEFAIIMLPDLVGQNIADHYIMAAHEMGHLVYDFAWGNASKKTRDNVVAAFEADRHLYSEPKWSAAFKEWYADQVALSVTHGALNTVKANVDEGAITQGRRHRGELWNVSAHFLRIVRILQKLHDLWKRLNAAVRSPLNNTFAQYMDGVILNQAVTKESAVKGRGNVLNMAKFRTKKIGVDHPTWLKLPHRLLGNVASNFKRLDKNLAALLFQHASGTGSRTGEKSYENLKNELESRYLSQYQSAMKKIGNQKKVRQAFDDLMNNNATAESLILRKMIDSINADLTAYMPTYTVRNDMLPQAFDHYVIDAKRKEFVALLRKHDVFANMGDKELNSKIDYLMDGQGFNERSIAPGKPVGAHAFSDLILSTVPQGDIKKFLVHEPDAIMAHYISSAAKRASWEHTFGGWVIKDTTTGVVRRFGGKWDESAGQKQWSPNKRWHDAMERIEAKHGKKAVEEAHVLLDGVFGRTGANMPNRLRKTQDNVLNVVNMNILANSGIASIPELGMAIARSANLLSLKDMFSGLNLREARRLGMDIGSVLSDGLAQIQGAGIGEAYQGSLTHKMASKFFILNGQQAVTRASRTLSTALGMRYIEKAADFNQFEELNAFHITAQQVKTWRALGKPAFTEGLSQSEAAAVRAVNGAIIQFVSESSFRPSKFQNTSWGNNPYLKIAFHLKQFLYAITDILVMGLLRQAKRRFSDARGEGLLAAGAYSIVPIVVGGVAIAGLTMAAIELRELLRGVDKTENMGDEKYAWEVFSKSGTLGAFEMGYRIMNAEDWDDKAGAIAPTFGYGQGIYHSATGSDSKMETIRHVTPFFSQYPNWWPFD